MLVIQLKNQQFFLKFQLLIESPVKSVIKKSTNKFEVSIIVSLNFTIFLLEKAKLLFYSNKNY